MATPQLYADTRRSLFTWLLMNGLGQGVLAVANAWLVMQLFDRLVLERGLSGPLLLALLAGIAGYALLRRHETACAERLAQDYVDAVRRGLYARLLRSDLRRLARQRRGSTLPRLVADLSPLQQWVGQGLARLLTAALLVSCALGALAWWYWPFALGLGVILLLAGVGVLHQGGVLWQALGQVRRAQANLAVNVTEKLANLATVQAFGQGRRERRLLQRQSERLQALVRALATRRGNLRALADATAGAALAAVLTAAYFASPAQLTLGTIVAAVSLIGVLMPVLRDLSQVPEYRLAAQATAAKLQEVEQDIAILPGNAAGKVLPITRGELRFERVSVERDLRDITVTAPGGSRVAVVGAPGSGKRTLLGVAGRLFAPDRGRVHVDGHDLAGVHLGALRRQVRFVGEEVPLQRGRLVKNLHYGVRHVDPAWLDKVLRDCGVDELIAASPDGLQRRLADGGADLTPSQRFRVGLARALLSRPRILLIDEPESGLDAAAIRTLDRVVRDFAGTLLVVTQRARLLRACDQVWHLHQGRLVAAGPPQQLLQEAGPTRNLFEKRPVDLVRG